MAIHKYTTVIIIAALILVQSADAITVKNVTTETIIGLDDFENNTSVSSAMWPDLSGDYNPDNATVGTWSSTESYSRVIQVTNYANPGGAYKGNNYLRIRREESYPYAKLMVVEQTTINDEINVKMMLNMSANNDLAGNISLFGKNSNGVEERILLVAFRDNARIMCYDGTQYIDTGLRYVANEWVILEIKWLIGTDTFSITYLGKTVEDLAVQEKDIISFTAVSVGGGSAVTAYYDAVPEPDSCEDVKSWYWLKISEADMNRDCKIDFYDFAILTANWLECNDPTDLINCTFTW